MELSEELNLLSHFSIIRDPRRQCGKRHKLAKIFCIAVCAIMSGAESWVEVEMFGKAKEDWLSGFMDLENGIPSHDTFGRVFGVIDPEEFQICFSNWVESLRKHVNKEVVAIDGKTLRRSFDKANEQLPFHIVSAWAHENELSLGQVQIDKKSNEIKAIPKLLKLLALEGCIVTLDAMGCQKEISKQIRAKKADYVLILKSNHKNLYRRAKAFFAEHEKSEFKTLQHEFCQTKSKSHGRYEERAYYLTTEINCLNPCEGWTDLQSLGMVKATRTVNGKTSTQTRFFISSLTEALIDDFARAVRCHWGIENKVHWILDVCLREDQSRVRKNYAAQNLAALRKIALNLIKLNKTTKKSFRVKKLCAAWNQKFALAMILGKNDSDLN
jgi:predicted transposase YbfD/YdcC